MNLSYRWLRSLAPTIDSSPRQVSDRLSMLGAPVDELVPLGEELGDVVIARVDEVRPHPNADRLRLCTVAAGGEPLQVVCGAPNVEAGRYYPFAPVGAALPGGVRIGKAKLRGEVSEGMLCSPRELGLGRDHAGLMMLAGEWEPGSRLVEELGLDDYRIAADVTPNRPDLLSHLGMARELAPGGVEDIRLETFAPGFEPPPLERVELEGEVGGVRVRIDDPVGCPRYMAGVVRGVRVGPSPEWLSSRLRAIGVRPINNVVDATNYVLHELGQPLHAFDLSRLDGSEIRVRRAAAGESLRTLDGIERALSDAVLVIADGRRPVAVAGVMGGEDSEVGGETRDILLECARFDEKSVRSAARALGLSTDASYRFERGVDPELQPVALGRVVDLVLAIAGGEAAPVLLDVAPAPAEGRLVLLRPERAGKLLGIEIGVDEIESLLRPIGFATQQVDGALKVSVPAYRPDVQREVDVVEEIARRRGYDSFPEKLVAFRPSVVPEDPLLVVEQRLRAVLERWGFLEARTAAFAPAAAERVPLVNPLSAEESHLRDALAPGLLRRVEHNWAHGVRDVRLYEVGTVFAPTGGEAPAREEVRLAAVFTGARRPPHWTGEAPSFDLWDLKGLFSELARELGAGEPGPAGAAPALLEPGEGLELTKGPISLGWAGRAAEGAIDAPAWADPVWVLEVALPATATAGAPPTHRPLPEFPAVERDLALLVPHSVAAEEVDRVVRDAAGEILSEIWPFDLYAGPGIPEGTRSIAWRLRFRRPDRTLTDPEVDSAVAAILRALDEELGVHRR